MVLLLSFMPTGWLVPWTNRLSEIVRLPLVPLGDIATSARVWLTVDDSLVATRDEFDLLERERNEYRRLYHASAERVRELEGLVGSLRGLPPVDAVGEYVAIEVDVIGSDPSAPRGPLQVNAGTRRGLRGGGVAIHRGDVLVGRVMREVGPTTAWIQPALATGLIDARVTPAALADAGGRDDVAVQLEPEGGGWRTTVDRSVAVTPGMVVRLHDAGWSRFAQGLAIGIVREVAPLESNPTRLEVRIRPVEDPRRLDRFLVVSQADVVEVAR